MFVYIILFISFLFVVGYILTYKDRATVTILLLAFAVRVFIMFADVHHWFPILNSGTDTEAFHQIAVRNQMLETNRTLTNYTAFLTLIYYMTDCSRLFAQYLNVLMGMTVLFAITKILNIVDVPRKRKLWALSILSFMPNMIIFSAILLREAWVEMFVALSALQFVYWYKRGNSLNMILCIAFVLAASYMHSGVIGLLAGYLAGFVIYRPKTGTTTISANTIIPIVLIFGLIFVFANYSALFLGKFQSVEVNSEEEFLEYVNNEGRGESSYLNWLPQTSNPFLIIVIAPIRMFYFLFAPLPTEWRRVVDIIGFLIDSLFYLLMCWAIYKKFAVQRYNTLKHCLVTALMGAVFVFAFGTSNAGTAFRHRAKLVSVIAVAYALSTKKYKQNQSCEKETPTLTVR